MQKKKISIAQMIVFGISFVLAYFAAQYFFSANKETPNAMLLTASKEMNKTMPKMVDSDTRLDSSSVENTTLNYHYTLINMVKDSSDMDFDWVKKALIEKAQEVMDTNVAMKDYRENNISLHYIYKDKNQNDVFDYIIKHQTKN